MSDFAVVWIYTLSLYGKNEFDSLNFLRYSSTPIAWSLKRCCIVVGRTQIEIQHSCFTKCSCLLFTSADARWTKLECFVVLSQCAPIRLQAHHRKSSVPEIYDPCHSALSVQC